MSPGALADLIVVVHLAIVRFVILGQVAVLVGWPLGWSFVRNLWFRVVHLGVMLFVAAQSAWDMICPLTTWEVDLRREAGGVGYEGGFIEHYLRDLLYAEAPFETLNIIYILFTAVVVLSLVFVPPTMAKVSRILSFWIRKGAHR